MPEQGHCTETVANENGEYVKMGANYNNAQIESEMFVCVCVCSRYIIFSPL